MRGARARAGEVIRSGPAGSPPTNGRTWEVGNASPVGVLVRYPGALYYDRVAQKGWLCVGSTSTAWADITGLSVAALSAAGDLIVYDGTSAVRLPLAVVSGQHLVARPEAVGLKVVWETPETAISADGSIFSFVGPLGGAGAKVVYDFTRYDPSKTLAQNLQGANIGGDGRLHLGPIGAPVYEPAVRRAIEDFRPRGSHVEGGTVWTDASVTARVQTNLAAADNDFRFLGAMTMELLVSVLQLSTTAGDSDQLCAMWAAGETEDTNALYNLAFGVAAGPAYSLTYSAEHDAGVNISASLGAVSTPVGAGPLHLVLTRDSIGRVTGYVNARRTCALTTPTDAGGGGVILPTRGATPTQQLSMGGVGGELNRLLWHAVKLCDYTYTDAQVEESYRRTFFGPGASL